MNRLARTRTPTPLLPWFSLWEANAYSSASPSIAALIGTNNRAVYTPVSLPFSATVTSVSFHCNTSTGNYDLGIYNDVFARLASQGTTALSSTGIKTLNCNLRFLAGEVFFVAMSFSSTVATIIRWAPGARSVQAAGLLQEDSAIPLPATATPVTITETNYPVFVLGLK